MAEITINSDQLKEALKASIIELFKENREEFYKLLAEIIESDGTFAKVPRQAARLLAAVESICSQRRNNPVAFPLEAKPLRMLHCKI